MEPSARTWPMVESVKSATTRANTIFLIIFHYSHSLNFQAGFPYDQRILVKILETSETAG